MSPPRWFRRTSQVESGIATYQVHDWWTRVFQVSFLLFASSSAPPLVRHYVFAHQPPSLACADSRYGFRKLIENRSLAIIQPDVMWLGGLTELIKVASWVFLLLVHRLHFLSPSDFTQGSRSQKKEEVDFSESMLMIEWPQLTTSLSSPTVPVHTLSRQSWLSQTLISVNTSWVQMWRLRSGTYK